MPLRIQVDRDLCEANAVCVKTAPDMFKVDCPVPRSSGPIVPDWNQRMKSGTGQRSIAA